MIKYTIIDNNGRYVKDSLTSRKRFDFVEEIEKASLFKDKNIAKNLLLAIKYQDRNLYELCKLVEIKFEYTIKAVE